MNTKNNPNPSNPARPSARNPQRHKRAQGFTIIELMITLTVAAILLAIAIPSFNYLTVSSKLTTTANDLVTAIGVARSEAIKRNAVVNLNADGSVSITTVNPAATTIVRAAVSVQTPVIIYGSPKALEATPMGILRVAGTTVGYGGLVADINSNRIATNNHRCVYLVTGTAVSSCTDSTTCATGGTPNATCK
ncbi:MAG: hypothetical protein B7Y07_08470 [Halothiobacillus sp. 24-54-40]|jgi:type IV fimbrial biogenesis protein FimT|nr:MAG: hypothetical protein B7X12_06140 [Halothiobacillus sp. 20-53-49]OYY36170.1 MAG: hypothetical protein B7Y58_07165 [Halothiobacillus sp. 35-54-62]OYY53852.1 MAG: hypothetical protein B7Y53_07020 [Halothiobacillus sp. 28-55-5]OYZ86317.1 MAG: hypothetical protein B7Y07_08470 [Halothiobacillus sp. 24-54-40]OZA80066.1 MAG: hypothetical protein B7X64_07455 [Halothiobacillus sp. 39-53-45]HQS02358.1 GspH/FimT family pseudopilin [Halothiobacillus sp.]